MAESGHVGVAGSRPDQVFDPCVEIASLRTNAAHQFDPVRFHYLETLAGRALQQQGAVRLVLDGKLGEALAVYRARFEQAQNEARDMIAHIAAKNPAAADDLQQLFVAGDFAALRRRVASLEKNAPPASLADLTRHLAQHSQESSDGSLASDSGALYELKTIRHSRNAWSKLSADRQLSQAIEQAPANAGPLNSHMLVLRSLALMREISPDYLKRYMSYVDTLLWLDQADKAGKPTARKDAQGESDRKMKGNRSRTQ